ncbi:DUF4091 domain-containing protein [Sphingobacterium deserti]|uniref:Uncharacterized protein n=1 Tax=Sphingobacterium deserti TaxID=1229276 RepID=A0A0B8T3E2_9SPHI|nr:DUF4091 domain-containing protein [Sphingobacterium deserti]KGE15621.1 hypothetical protein DI53_0725 [Sphingobacterium deserti]
MKNLKICAIVVLLLGNLSGIADDTPINDGNTVNGSDALNGSFESKFKRYSVGQMFTGIQEMNWSDTVWRNDRIHKQIVLWSDRALNDVRYEVSDLVGTEGYIPAASVSLRFPSYVLGDLQTGSCDAFTQRTDTFIADALSSEKVTSITPGEPVKVWVTIDIPDNVHEGKYSGTMLVKGSDDAEQKFTFDILVVNKTLPPVADWSYHLDLWQFPFQLLSLYNSSHADKIKPFSAEYFRLIKPFYALLADAGQKAITTYIKDGAVLDGQTMIKWNRNDSGMWTYDFSDFDAYVEHMMQWGIKKQINCFSIAGWNSRSIAYFDGATSSNSKLEVKAGSPDFTAVWNSFLDAFKKHLKAKGWFDKTVLYMDETTDGEMSEIVKVIKQHDKRWKIGIAGHNVRKETEENLYDYATILGYNKLTQFRGDRINTFYTSCSQTNPNNYVSIQNSPAEMTWMAWHAAALGFNGYLRWAYDYWTKENPIDVRDGSNCAGDFSMIYRTDNSSSSKPVSSMRLELLREGIQDYEKIRILNNATLNEELKQFSATSGAYAPSLVPSAQGLLKKISTL